LRKSTINGSKSYDSTGVKKTLFFWAWILDEIRSWLSRSGGWYDFQLKIGRNKIILGKWREALGVKYYKLILEASATSTTIVHEFFGLLENKSLRGLWIDGNICNFGLYM